MSALLGCHDLTKAYQGRTLFEDLTLAIEEGERIGLIGPNGAGKSTLLRILAGLDEADSGERVLSRGVRLAVVDQTDDFEPGSTPEQVVLAALTDEPDEVARITRAQIVLSKVGFEATDQPVSTLSGGWRKRLSLARALVVEPDLVLLDEPTNHLDLRGIAWLEKLLGNASFAWLMISHDRYMLERVANRVVEIGRHYPGGHLRVEGSYSTFLLKREELLAAQRSREASLKNTVRREVEWLRRGPRGRGTKAKGRIKAAGAAMEELADVQERNAARTLDSFAFSGTGRRSRELLRVTDLILERGGKRLCSGLELSLGPGDRIGVLGDNGCGKSTLLGTLAGELEPAAGKIKLAKDLRVVTFHQDRSRLDPEATLRETLVNEGDTVDYRGQRMHVKSWAKRFLFEPDRLEIRIKALSGGEQARLLIAELIRQPADLLILDEPTNDLDLATREVLEESLESFPGAVILVTHDRYLLEQVCTGLLGFDGQGNVHPLADLIQWERLLARLAKQEKEARAKERAKNKPAAPRRERRLSSKERRELEGIEAAIEAAEAQADLLEQKTQEPEIATDHVALLAACDALSAAQKHVEHLYTRWELLEAKKAGGGP